MKFKTGDKFKVKENGIAGEIRGYRFNSILQEEEYIVEWNHRKGQEETYVIGEADSIWELDITCPVVEAYKTIVANAINSIPIKIEINSELLCNTYNHDWIDVGFHHSKIVCKVCNKVKDAN